MKRAKAVIAFTAAATAFAFVLMAPTCILPQLLTIFVAAVTAFACVYMTPAWINGKLSIWMDADRVSAIQQLGREFEHDLGIKVQADATEKIPNNFPRNCLAMSRFGELRLT